MLAIKSDSLTIAFATACAHPHETPHRQQVQGLLLPYDLGFLSMQLYQHNVESNSYNPLSRCMTMSTFRMLPLTQAKAMSLRRTKPVRYRNHKQPEEDKRFVWFVDGRSTVLRGGNNTATAVMPAWFHPMSTIHS